MNAILRAIAGYCFLILVVRAVGRRPGKQLAWLKDKSPRFGAIVDGTPLVLIKDGEWQLDVMRGMRVDPEDVMAAARTKSVSSVFDIKYAVLERNGTISIIKNERRQR
jgi:uncharacterized membrane protein YcaP (DUF421 family)